MKNKTQILELLKSTPIVQVACQKSGVSRATYYRWRDKDKKFKEQSDSALKEGIAFINDLAESQLLSSIKEKNMTAIIFWLKNRHSGYDTTKLQITSPESSKEEPLTSEQQELVNKALQMASILPATGETDNETTTKGKQDI